MSSGKNLDFNQIKWFFDKNELNFTVDDFNAIL